MLFNEPNYPINIIGTRHGEKLYETLLSREEMAIAKDIGNFYKVSPDLRDLNYDKFYEKGEEVISHSDEYNSHNTNQLDEESMKLLLKRLPGLDSIIEGTRESLED